jgi:hypothetical protein
MVATADPAIADIDLDGVMEIICETNGPYGTSMYDVCPKISVTKLESLESKVKVGQNVVNAEISCSYAPTEKSFSVNADLYFNINGNWTFSGRVFTTTMEKMNAGEKRSIDFGFNLLEKKEWKIIVTVDEEHSIWKSDETNTFGEVVVSNDGFLGAASPGAVFSGLAIGVAAIGGTIFTIIKKTRK